MFTKLKEVGQECSDDIFCGVNTVGDTKFASDLEKKHLPIITVPKKIQKGKRFEISVEVGKLLKHSNEPSHFIQFIELYVDDTYLARMDFTAQMTEPIMNAYITLEHSYEKIRAFGRCNLHGTWENEIEIEVE